MKFLDLAIAGIIGLSSIGAMSLWSPASDHRHSARVSGEILLRDRILEVVSANGVDWFQQEPPAAICSFLTTYSNSSLTITAIVDSSPCGASPPLASSPVEISLRFSGRVVTLEGWYDVEQ